MRALACPASLKGVLAARDAAAALAHGVRRVSGWEADELAVADGGEGTAEALAGALGGSWHHAAVHDPLGRDLRARFLLLEDGTAVVESAEAVGLGLVAPAERDPLRASSAGLGELLLAALACSPRAVLVGLGGTATVDGGAGVLATVGSWPRETPLRVACDVRNPLLGPRGAARAFGPQKGAARWQVDELERRLAAMEELAPFRAVPGAGAGGGLGAGLAALGGELCGGAELVLDALDFDARARSAQLIVTGEGTVDRSTLEGKAPGAVLSRCARLGVRCVLFGGRVTGDGPSARELQGGPSHAVEDLHDLGEALAREAG